MNESGPGAQKERTTMRMQKEKTASQKEKQRGYQKRYRARHPEKCRAHSIVARAIKNGALVKGRCAVCKTYEDVEAHHSDYSRPRDVHWLCWYHHKLEHRILKPEKFAKDPFNLVFGLYRQR